MLMNHWKERKEKEGEGVIDGQCIGVVSRSVTSSGTTSEDWRKENNV